MWSQTVGKTLTNLGFRQNHSRIWTACAVVRRSELEAHGISSTRVRTIEGQPGVFTLDWMWASYVFALLKASGSVRRARFIVSVRNPIRLAISLATWNGMRQVNGVLNEWKESLHLGKICDSFFDAVDRPSVLFALPLSRLRAFVTCLSRPKGMRIRHAGPLLSGLYALSLMRFIRLGLAGSQFLLVPVLAFNERVQLTDALARFLQLPTLKLFSTACRAPVNTQSPNFGNMSYDEFKRHVMASKVAEELELYFKHHSELLPPLVAAQDVQVVPENNMTLLAQELRVPVLNLTN